MLVTSSNSRSEPIALDNGLFARDCLLPGAALAIAGLLCYVISLWVFKQRTIGGWAWAMPFWVSAGLAVALYRWQCLSVGVLTNAESLSLARTMSVWAALAIVIIYSLIQESVAYGIVALFMGGTMFILIIFAGFFTVKTLLLLQNKPDREHSDGMSLGDIEKIKAEYRVHKGINKVHDSQIAMPLSMQVGGSSASNVRSAGGGVGAYKAVAIAELPPHIYSPASSGPTASRREVTSAPIDEEIRLKIIELRKQALRAQRRTEMKATGTAPAATIAAKTASKAKF